MSKQPPILPHGVHKTTDGFLAAFCTSDQCVIANLEHALAKERYRHLAEKSTRASDRVMKAVSLSTIFCPDCEHALFWERNTGNIELTAAGQIKKKPLRASSSKSRSV